MVAFPDLDAYAATLLKTALDVGAEEKSWFKKKYQTVKAALQDQAKPENVARLAASQAVSALAKSAHANPAANAIKPAMAALDVLKIQNTLEKTYALFGIQPYPVKYAVAETFPCTCEERQVFPFTCFDKDNKLVYSERKRDRTDQKCADFYEFFVAQQESKASRKAVVGSVAGIPFYLIFAAGEEMRKKLEPRSDQKTFYAHALVGSALPALSVWYGMSLDGRRVNHDIQCTEKGCRRAQAFIALLFGELDLKSPSGTLTDYPKTMAAMLDPAGSEAVGDQMKSGLLF